MSPERWNPESMSRSFISAAEDAERYMKQCKSKVAQTDRYKELHDEHLAKFYVYNYLHGRTFLETREQFLAELREMVAADYPAPHEAFDPNTFTTWRKSYIQNLIDAYKQ
jgi:hypothetical protein